MMFNDRDYAAYLLLNKLKHYKGKNAVVLGIPRGAMPMAKIIADGLNAELDTVFVHKIPSPFNEEVSIGCVGLSGNIYLLPYVNKESFTETYLKTFVEKQLSNFREKQRLYQSKKVDYSGRIVIVIDDGIATGATTVCAVQEVKNNHPAKIVLATPVAPAEVGQKLSLIVDEFISLYLPEDMSSVGQYYNSFPQISDEEVIVALNGS